MSLSIRAELGMVVGFLELILLLLKFGISLRDVDR